MTVTKLRELKQQFAVILEREGVDVALHAQVVDELVTAADATLRRRARTPDGERHEQFMAVLAAVTHSDPATKRGQLARAAALLRDSPEEYDPQQLMRWYGASGWWYAVHRQWVAKRGEHVAPPTIQQVIDTVLQAKRHYVGAEDPNRWTRGSYADIIEH